MDLYNYQKTLNGFQQTEEFVSIGYMSEFTSKVNVENFIKRHPNNGLELSQFEFLLKADDSHMRETPIEHPFFEPLELIDIVEKIQHLTKDFIDEKNFEDLKAFLRNSSTNNQYVQALIG